MWVRTLIIVLLLVLIDLYVWQGIRLLTKSLNPFWQRSINLLFWGFTIFSIAIFSAMLLSDWKEWPKAFRTYSFALIFIVYFAKIVWVLFLLADDLTRLFRWGWSKLRPSSALPAEAPAEAISRSAFLVRLGMLSASVPMLAMIYGMIRTAYQYKVHHIPFAVNNLPKAFRGFRIIQISDIHIGSFMSTEPFAKAVELINSQKADLIVFTGDLVNNKSEEVLPFLEEMKKLKAPYGVYSVLGNHDYGDYVAWPDRKAKEENLNDLIRYHRQSGWDILLDEHRSIEKDGERMTITGVQNWSQHLRFPKYGDIDKAMEGFVPGSFNLLLSHDPSHWRGQILEERSHFQLTLSGHTHGFQFGVEIPGFRWSPVQYVYKEWAGLYTENGQSLYVNRGLGFLGYPGRVGILPEITLIELQNA